MVPPNGSRLSCGRSARRRKVVERRRRFAGETTQLFLTCARPSGFKRLLGGGHQGAFDSVCITVRHSRPRICQTLATQYVPDKSLPPDSAFTTTL